MQDPTIAAEENYKKILENVEAHLFSPLEALFNLETLNARRIEMLRQKANCSHKFIQEYAQREMNFLQELQQLQNAPLLNTNISPATLTSIHDLQPLSGKICLPHGYVLDLDKLAQYKITLSRKQLIVDVRGEESRVQPLPVPYGPINTLSHNEARSNFAKRLREKWEIPVMQEQEQKQEACTIM